MMDSLESTGKILEQARKDQGKSIPDMEGLTKIRGRFLQALEDDQFGVLPGDVYVRGFLRTYANTLHLDAEALIAKYKEDLSSVPLSDAGKNSSAQSFPVPGRRSLSRMRIVLYVMLVLVVAGAFFFLAKWP